MGFNLPDSVSSFDIESRAYADPIYCADCGREIDDDKYEVDGDMICLECLAYRFKKED